MQYFYNTKAIDHLKSDYRLCVAIAKTTPGYARGKEELRARKKVDKKKTPWYSRSGLPTTQLK